MPLTKSVSKQAFSDNVAAERNAGKKRDQALAIAYRIQREAKQHMASGGAPHPDHGGLINSEVPGRTDRIPMKMRSGGYVIPADIVSAVGQGNTAAGASAFNKLLKMGPYGSSALGSIRIPKPHKFASGGDVPIIAAGGEFAVPPDKVAEIGGGDVNRGHDILDAMVKHVRAKTIKTLRKLPGPKKS